MWPRVVFFQRPPGHRAVVSLEPWEKASHWPQGTLSLTLVCDLCRVPRSEALL